MTLAMAFSWILVPGGGDTVEDVGDRSQTRRGGLGQAIQVAASDLGEFADQVGVVQEHPGPDEGDDLVRLGSAGVVGLSARPVVEGGLQLRAQSLRLLVGQHQRGILGAMSVAQPPLVGATKTSGVVLQLQQVQSVAGEDEQVHLRPNAVVIAELEARPGPERRFGGQQVADNPQALGFMGEL